jgi:hypothetical protein
MKPKNINSFVSSWMMQHRVDFLRKGEFLDEIETLYGKALTYGWLSRFMNRHQDELMFTAIHPPESLRLEIPRTFLNQYLDLIRTEV